MTIQIEKIANQDDGFLINYYTAKGGKVIIANKENMVSEINKAFKDIEAIRNSSSLLCGANEEVPSLGGREIIKAD